MFADWDCIFRKFRAGGDGRDKPGHDGVKINYLGAWYYLPMRRGSMRRAIVYTTLAMTLWPLCAAAQTPGFDGMWQATSPAPPPAMRLGIHFASSAPSRMACAGGMHGTVGQPSSLQSDGKIAMIGRQGSTQLAAPVRRNSFRGLIRRAARSRAIALTRTFRARQEPARASRAAPALSSSEAVTCQRGPRPYDSFCRSGCAGERLSSGRG